MSKFRIRDFINYKTAIGGAVFMGGLVFYMNYREGCTWESSGVAAMKQAIYTFFLGGLCVRISEVIAVKVRQKWLGILLGTLVASLITITAAYTIHSLKGTPYPLQSTLPTIVLAPISFVILAWYYRVQTDRQNA